MELNLFKGTSLLETNALHIKDNVYIPGIALNTHVGVWEDKVSFVDSPLAGKQICLTVLGPGTFSQGLPPAVELFISLCSAAGAQIIYYDGGKIPAGDLILALETGGSTPDVSFLGAAFRSKPLARKITANLKRGLGFTYLPDPTPFQKPRYNLKLRLGARLFTPAVAIQLPSGMEEIGAWLFTSLMEFLGKDSGMDAAIFLEEAPFSPPEPEPVPSQPATALPEPKDLPAEKPEMPRSPTKARIYPRETQSPSGTAASKSGSSASMSSFLYPEFFTQSDDKKKTFLKEPFT